MSEALLYEKLEEGKVRCDLCAHACVIKSGRSGICGVRRNDGGRLTTLVYGRLIAQHIDPIEKKPLFHLLPGSRSYSIATVGCNFRCRFCQNADIAQMPNDRDGLIMGSSIRPEAVVADALAQGCQSIAYTYTEPTIFFEFAYDTAQIAHAKGIKNVFVTNGYMSARALEMIAPYLDAANVDLKSYDDHFYRTQCSARLEPVKQTLQRMKALDILVEVTTLIVPGLNDQPDNLQQLATFLVEALGPDTPWHISRFHPTYLLTDRPVTPAETLRQARQIGLEAGLRYIYVGNVPGQEGESTACHQCGAMLIERRGFEVRRNLIREGSCPECRTPVYGVGMSSSH
jgi:pyruvate formate lyase activating enzyme